MRKKHQEEHDLWPLLLEYLPSSENCAGFAWATGKQEYFPLNVISMSVGTVQLGPRWDSGSFDVYSSKYEGRLRRWATPASIRTT